MNAKRSNKKDFLPRLAGRLEAKQLLPVFNCRSTGPTNLGNGYLTKLSYLLFIAKLFGEFKT